MAEDLPGLQTVTVALPEDLLDWLHQRTAAMEFPSVELGVAHCVNAYRELPPEIRNYRY